MSDEPSPRDLPTRPGMRASVVAGTAMFAMAQGISMERITAQTGLRPSDLHDPDGWLPEAIMPGLWRLLAKACPDRVVFGGVGDRFTDSESAATRDVTSHRLRP